MATPQIPQKSPYVKEEPPGKRAWCACGLSTRQPYCDGSHIGTGISPVIVEIKEKKFVPFEAVRSEEEAKQASMKKMFEDAQLHSGQALKQDLMEGCADDEW